MYRAKVKSDDPIVRKRWAYGDKVTIGDRVFIVLDDSEYDENGLSHGKCQEVISGFIEVTPESVGQSTGLKDREGVVIYEGDIVKTQHGNYPVGWLVHHARFAAQYGQVYVKPECWDRHEIIGNTTDNPKLLEKP